MPDPVPFKEAVDRLESKTPVGSALRTDAWARVPLDTREAAFFSAGVREVSTLTAMQDILDEALTLNPEDAFADRSRFVADMRARLGAVPGDSGDLRDITSRRRLELIYDFTIEDATSFGRWKGQQTPELLDAFPAQELVRVEARQERRDWVERWTAEGGRLYGGRMIALINDPIWKAISRFDRPWSPFDFGSGMGVQSVSRREAVRLGVIEQDAPTPQAPEVQFNEDRKASLRGAPATIAEQLTKALNEAMKANAVRQVVEDGRSYLVMEAKEVIDD